MRILNALLILCALILASFLSLQKTDYGLRSTSFHIDGANHLSIAETIWQGIDPRSRNYFLILDKYPNLSHRVVAIIAHARGADLLQVMAATNGILVYAGCLLVSLRWVVLIRQRSAAVSEVSILFGLTLAGLTTIFGLGSMAHHFQANYFFPHIFSTVLAMLLLLALQNCESFVARAGIFILGTVLLTKMHLVGALWFIIAALIFMLGAGKGLRGILHSFGLACLAVLIGMFTREVRNMVMIAEGNGGALLPIGNLTELPAIIAATIIVPLGLLVYHGYRRIRLGGRAQLALILMEHAGLLAILSLAVVLVFALLVFGKGSVYGLAKLNFLLITETIGLVFVFSPAIIDRDKIPVRSEKARYAWSMGLIALCFCAQRPWKLDAHFDQEKLIFYRDNLYRAKHEIARVPERLFPQFSLPSWANFYLYLGVMQQGIDPQSWEWYESDCTAGKAIGPEFLKHRTLPTDRIIRFDPPMNSWRYATMGWDNPEMNGCWTSGSPARLMISFEDDFWPKKIMVEALAFVPERGDEVEVDVIINGKKVSHWRFSHPSDFNFTNTTVRALELGPIIDGESKVVLIDFVVVRQTRPDTKSLFVKKIKFL